MPNSILTYVIMWGPSIDDTLKNVYGHLEDYDLKVFSIQRKMCLDILNIYVDINIIVFVMNIH